MVTIAGLVLLFLLIGFGVLGTWYPMPGLVGALAVLLVPLAALPVSLVRRSFGLGRWTSQNGWRAVARDSRPWPWEGLALSGRAEVGRAWSRSVEGFPVTVGEVRWSGGAFAGAVRERESRGLFVVVELPGPQPGMAMRLPQVVVGDSPMLASPELGAAFLTGEIPPWTVRDDELFTVEIVAVDPAHVTHAVSRALRAVRLLGLAPAA